MSKTYKYLDDLISVNRRNTLNNFIENGVENKFLDFYDLEIYKKEKNKREKLKSIINESHFNPDITLTKYQTEIISLLDEGNLFLSSPTSFGKTYTILEYIERNREYLKNIVFIIPTIALMNELTKKIYDKFSDEYNISIYGAEDEDEGKKNIFILVPERCDTAIFERLAKTELDLVIFDEIYKLKSTQKININGFEDDRIILMNRIYLKLVSLAKKIVMMGPYIENVDFENSNIEITKYFTNYSPVVNNYELLTNNWVDHISANQLIYFNSPGSIYKNIGKIIEATPISLHYAQKYRDEIFHLESFATKEWYVVEMLKRGIGIHHGKTPMFLRRFFEQEYANGNLRALLCTSTLMEGINTPTTSMIIVDKISDVFELNNLIGRVGRLNPKNPVKGNVFIVDKETYDLLNDTKKWLNLTILAENPIPQNDDDAFFLNKKYPDEISNERLRKDIDIICKEYNITRDELRSRNIKLSELTRLASNKELVKKFMLAKTNFDFIVLTLSVVKFTKLTPFTAKTYKNILVDGKYLDTFQVISDLLHNKSISYIVSNFTKKYNVNKIAENTNIYIDGIFELEKYIKFAMPRIIEYMQIIGIDKINQKANFFIATLSKFGGDDIKDKILDNLGIEQMDRWKIIGLSEKGNVSTSSIIKLIRNNRETIISDCISPFTRKNINNI